MPKLCSARDSKHTITNSKFLHSGHNQGELMYVRTRHQEGSHAMQSSLRDLLSWVWQIVLSWVASLTTGIYRPLCFGRSTNMVVKANDPESAVRRDSEVLEEETRLQSDPHAVLQIEGEKRENGILLESVPRTHIGEITGNDHDGDEMTEGIVDVEASADDSETDTSKESTDDTTSESSSVDANQVGEATEGENANVSEEQNSSNPNAEDAINSSAEEDINSMILAAMQFDLFDWEDENEDNAQTEGSKMEETNNESRQEDIINEDDERKEEVEEDPKEDDSVTWLLEVGPKETYQKVLSPKYHCLNFRTAVAVDRDKVNVALKQLRCLLPWLGIGLKRRKENMWLCLHPEESINFKMMYGGQTLWDAVLNSSEDFNYLDNNTLSSFTLMKASPCDLCQAFVDSQACPDLKVGMQMPKNHTDKMSNNSDKENPPSSSSSGSSSLCDTVSDKDSGVVEGESNSASLPSTTDVGQTVESSTALSNTASEVRLLDASSCSLNVVASCDGKDSTNCNASPTPFETNPSDTPIPEAASANSPSGTSMPEASSANNLSDTSVPEASSENSDTSVPKSSLENSPSDSPVPEASSASVGSNKKVFPHNYRLLISIPHPLADDESVTMICDGFLKELDAVISCTGGDASSSVDGKKTNVEKSDVERTSETDEAGVDDWGATDGNGAGAGAVASNSSSGEDCQCAGETKQADCKVGQSQCNGESKETDSEAKQSHCSGENKETDSEVDQPHCSSENKKTDSEAEQPHCSGGSEQTNSEVDQPHCSDKSKETDSEAEQPLCSGESKQSDSEIDQPHCSGESKETDCEADQPHCSGNSKQSDSELDQPHCSGEGKEMNSEVEKQQCIDKAKETDSKVDQPGNSITGEDIAAKRKASVMVQFTILSDIFARTETPKPKVENSNAPPNNNESKNENVINRNSPHVFRTIDAVNSRNFINKCKSKRISYVSAFAICVDTAISLTLAKSGVKCENANYRIGHTVRPYYNLDDLTDNEWHDHDPNDDDDDEEENEEEEYSVCCRKPTVTLNSVPSDKFNQMWERVQMIDSKCRGIPQNTRDSPPQIIPLNTEHPCVDDSRFSPILQPEANLAVTNISDLSKEFSRQEQSLESLTFESISPYIAFLMTNSISLHVQNGILKFSFYNQQNLISNATAHEYADEIASILDKSL